MRYYKRHWDDSRGDEFDNWGSCTYLFEIADDLCVDRQMEVYENGSVLLYDRQHLHDQYGGLAEGPLAVTEEELAKEWNAFEITKAEFEQEWARRRPLNR